jgi:hypothetical protein
VGLCLAASLGACATTPGSGPDAERADVLAFEVRLDGPDDGALHVELSLPRPRAPFEELEWKLYLKDLCVAAGVERIQEATSRGDGRVGLTFDTPLLFRGVPWRRGSAFVQVRLSGVVRLRAPAVAEYRFAANREVLVRGLPSLE